MNDQLKLQRVQFTFPSENDDVLPLVAEEEGRGEWGVGGGCSCPGSSSIICLREGKGTELGQREKEERQR